MGLREKLEELRQQGLNEIANSDDLKNVNDIRVVLRRNLEGNPLFPDGFLDEDVDCRRHAHADGVAKPFKVFFQIRVDADTNRCLCHFICPFLH